MVKLKNDYTVFREEKSLWEGKIFFLYTIIKFFLIVFLFFFSSFNPLRHTPLADPALSSHTTASNYTSPSIKSDTSRSFLNPETDIPDTLSTSLISRRAIPKSLEPSLFPYSLSSPTPIIPLPLVHASVSPDTLYPAPYTSPPVPSTYTRCLHTIPLPPHLPAIPPTTDYHAPTPN